jgi:hypothetical protein
MEQPRLEARDPAVAKCAVELVRAVIAPHCQQRERARGGDGQVGRVDLVRTDADVAGRLRALVALLRLALRAGLLRLVAGRAHLVRVARLLFLAAQRRMGARGEEDDSAEDDGQEK